MLIVNGVFMPRALLAARFQCDYMKCGSKCCVVGDQGAPLLERELPSIQKYLPFMLSNLDEEAQRCIDHRGFYEVDGKDFVTNCVDGIGRCVFSKVDSTGGVSCYLETFSQMEGIATIRPVSCRLFPIRVRNSNGLDIIDYEVWEECSHAWNKGSYLLDFCREALLERFGKEWMDKLETIRQRRLG